MPINKKDNGRTFTFSVDCFWLMMFLAEINPFTYSQCELQLFLDGKEKIVLESLILLVSNSQVTATQRCNNMEDLEVGYRIGGDMGFRKEFE